MSKFHLGRRGPARCRALVRTCPFGGPESHFDSMGKAEAALASQYISFKSVAKPGVEEVRDTYQRLFTLDDEIAIETYDSKFDEHFTYGQRVGNEALHNPDFLKPNIYSNAPPEKPEQASGIAMKGEAYVNAEALEGLRRDIFECRVGELDARQRDDDATERFFLGWRSALELIRDGVSEDLVEARIPAGDLLRSWSSLKADMAKRENNPDSAGHAIGTIEDIQALATVQCSKHSRGLDEQESPFDHDTPEHDGYVDALLKFEVEADDEPDELFISEDEEGNLEATLR